ncbi:hypothetical protein X975_09222, partial [Stegodyphus mimosarum]
MHYGYTSMDLSNPSQKLGRDRNPFFWSHIIGYKGPIPTYNRLGQIPSKATPEKLQERNWSHFPKHINPSPLNQKSANTYKFMISLNELCRLPLRMLFCVTLAVISAVSSAADLTKVDDCPTRGVVVCSKDFKVHELVFLDYNVPLEESEEVLERKCK